jgi:hypothetical protein
MAQTERSRVILDISFISLFNICHVVFLSKCFINHIINTIFSTYNRNFKKINSKAYPIIIDAILNFILKLSPS